MTNHLTRPNRNFCFKTFYFHIQVFTEVEKFCAAKKLVIEPKMASSPGHSLASKLAHGGVCNAPEGFLSSLPRSNRGRYRRSVVLHVDSCPGSGSEFIAAKSVWSKVAESKVAEPARSGGAKFRDSTGSAGRTRRVRDSAHDSSSHSEFATEPASYAGTTTAGRPT